MSNHKHGISEILGVSDENRSGNGRSFGERDTSALGPQVRVTAARGSVGVEHKEAARAAKCPTATSQAVSGGLTVAPAPPKALASEAPVPPKVSEVTTQPTQTPTTLTEKVSEAATRQSASERLANAPAAPKEKAREVEKVTQKRVAERRIVSMNWERTGGVACAAGEQNSDVNGEKKGPRSASIEPEASKMAGRKAKGRLKSHSLEEEETTRGQGKLLYKVSDEIPGAFALAETNSCCEEDWRERHSVELSGDNVQWDQT